MHHNIRAIAALFIGDPSKAANAFGWKAKTHWKELAELMVDADIELLAVS